MKKKILITALVAAFVMACLAGCAQKTKNENEKIKDIEFTVLGEENIPEELKTTIEQKKEKAFKLTYRDSDFLYICVGYGSQDTGGYSITVNALYLAENAIYVDTNLIGPEAAGRELYKAQKKESNSYPYIVIKTEYLEKSVVFD